jgi:3-hydroxybutyryl-CoA dehydrogenase
MYRWRRSGGHDRGKDLVMKGIGVVGAGQMGAGIAQVAATAGYLVVVSDVSAVALKKGAQAVEKSLAKLESKGLVHDVAGILSRIKWQEDLLCLSDCDLVIEAVVENERVKKDIFCSLDQILKPSAIIATNTSSISITRLASATKRPEKFIGMHFMNPVPLMNLVELIKGHHTSDDTVNTIKQVVEQLKKISVVAKDFPGFIANRVLMPMINEAFFALLEGVGTALDIDTTMKHGCNMPMGPLALADFIGLDTCLAIMEVLHQGLGDDKYRPCPLLKNYVAAGLLGKKSGAGVYTYQS